MTGARVAGELSVLAGCFVTGLAAGALYDATRLLRLPFRKSRLRDTVFDLLFYAAAGALFSLALYELNGGSPRLYALSAFALGLFAYIKSASEAITAAAREFARRRHAERKKKKK